MICKSTRPVNPSNSTTQQPVKPMRVLHLIDSGGLYGAEVMLLNLVAEQVKMGLDPVIGSIGGKGIPEKPLEAEALRRGLKVQQFRFRNGPNLLGTYEILRFCRKKNVDLLHSHGYKPNILLGFMPAMLRGVSIVTTLHGWTSTKGDKILKIYEWLDSKSLRFIDAVVAVSQSMLSHPRLQNRSLSNVHVIHNGIPVNDGASGCYPSFERNPAIPKVDLEPQRPDGPTTPRRRDPVLDQSIIDFCAKRFTIGSIGRLSPEKGYSYLIQAVQLLVSEGLDINLLIIGEGKERRLLEDLVTALGLKERIFLPGYRSEAWRYLRYIEILAMASLTEGLPISLLEAMNAGVPIVATNTGGIPEVLENAMTGLLVKMSDPKELALGLKRIYEDRSLRSRLASDAYETVCARFTTHHMALKYLEIYEQLSNRTNRLRA